jgi:hypothetical protein
MAEATTALNESLACVALGYIAYVKGHNLEHFNKLINKELPTTNAVWKTIVDHCQISETSIDRYYSVYKNDDDGKMNPWIYTSYQTAISIKNSLSISSLKGYIFSRVEKAGTPDAYVLKQKATSAIKKYAKEWAKETGQSEGILGKLNADKINIGDIFLIKANSTIKDDLINLIKESDVSPGKIRKKIKDRFKNPKDYNFEKTGLLTPRIYRAKMVQAWRSKQIISVSLKALDTKSPTIPVTIKNTSGINNLNYEEIYKDEFAEYLSGLILIAKNQGLSKFEEAVGNFVTIDYDANQFTSSDRLLVHYYLNYGAQQKKYHIFTNFGSGNAIHFVPEGSKSASGEGGITINYFYTLVQQFPQLTNFFKELSEIRKNTIEAAFNYYNTDFNKVNEKLTSKLTSARLHKVFYTSAEYGRLIDEMLGAPGIHKLGDIKKNSNEWKAIISINEEQTFYVLDADGNTVEQTKKVKVYDDSMTIVDKTNVYILQKFFADYTAKLSNARGSMGGLLGKSVVFKKSIRDSIEKERKKIMKQTTRKKDPLPEAKAKQQVSAKIREIVMESKKAVPTFKKAYALLTNAEFGFFFAKHQTIIQEILKKQVLLSFYAAASGRGYIIFDGQRFAADDFFQQNVSPPPFIKVGK